MRLSRENNFDLIRLIAALQVVFWHSKEHINFPDKSLNTITGFLGFFPGVAIFFTISGFLIYASYDRNKDLKTYLRNRFLRIYPGLWTCLFFTIILLVSFNFINSRTVLSIPSILWFITQISIFQIYTPVFLKDFGVGNPNGSLWTIPIEISFYFLVPLLFWLIRKTKLSSNIIICISIILSYQYNWWYDVNFKSVGPQSNAIKLMGLNLAPYLFYFLLGSFAYVNWGRIKKWYEGKGLIWLIIYLGYCLVFSVWLKKFTPSYWPNLYGILSIVILSQTILALAYSQPKLSPKLLRGNDISYGIYLYHMPVINSILQLGYKGYNWSFAAALFFTTIMAVFSWKFVEKPMLFLKKGSTQKKSV